MSQMHQMQLSYVPTEDRILFRMNTKARQEFRFWMTRRYVSILWKSLAKLISDPEEKLAIEEKKRQETPKDPLIESTKKEIEHQEIISKSDFETQYQESTYLPLGEDPALLFSVGVKPNPSGPPLLCMHPEKGQGVEMALNDQILHSLCKLIIDTSNKAGWQLELKLVEDTEEDGDASAGLN